MKFIGVMTGNSLDGVDVVLTDFNQNQIKDIDGVSLPFPEQLRMDFLSFRNQLKIKKVTEINEFPNLIKKYTELVAKAINQLDKTDVVAIGLHGQTCDHFPPSIAGSKKPYTLQVFDAKLLAELTDLPVIYDFRSDDLMNGGEGAPLAPMHNAHLSADLKQKGYQSIIFLNGGNTGNLSAIYGGKVLGFDAGPFNHLTDMLVRTQFNRPFDADGEIGKQGKLQPDLLRLLFNTCAKTDKGENFYELRPPKSSDPSWYKMPENNFSIYDQVRTTTFFATYSLFYALSFLPTDMPEIDAFLTFGGGWHNPLCCSDFTDLINRKAFVLPEHKDLFEKIKIKQNVLFSDSQKLGYSGVYMEARIFADLAYCKVMGISFTTPEITGVKQPTILGICCLPSHLKNTKILDYLQQFEQNPVQFSRAYLSAVCGN